MICKTLAQSNLFGFTARTTECERHDFLKTNQVVLRVKCRLCSSWHTIDISGSVSASADDALKEDVPPPNVHVGSAAYTRHITAQEAYMLIQAYRDASTTALPGTMAA